MHFVTTNQTSHNVHMLRTASFLLQPNNS